MEEEDIPLNPGYQSDSAARSFAPSTCREISFLPGGY